MASSPKLYRQRLRLGGAFCVLLAVFFPYAVAFAGGLTVPGDTNATDKLTAAGTLLHIVDSFLFVFGARIMAGLAVLGAGWNLKEQRFAMAIICVLAAIVIGTVLMWIANIFAMGGGSIFTNTR